MPPRPVNVKFATRLNSAELFTATTCNSSKSNMFCTRFTAPSLIFESDGRRMFVGGFQPVEAYDVLLAHLAPGLPRRGAPLNVAEMLAALPEGVFTAEAAAVLRAHHLDRPDVPGAEARLIEAVAAGAARRVDVGDSALWLSA